MAKRIERDLSARRLEMEHEEAMAEHLGEVARIEADKEDQIHNGLMAILVGLACLVFVGVFWRASPSSVTSGNFARVWSIEASLIRERP